MDRFVARRRVTSFRRAPRLTLLTVGLLAAGIAAGVVTASTGRTVATAPSNTASPAVSGTAQQGQTLTATTGSWSGDTPISYAFVWQRCDSSGGTCGNIAGATNQTYTITSTDVGGTLRAVVTATNASGGASAASSPTGAVTTPAVAPGSTAQPSPHGTAQVGQTLSVDNGGWSGTTPITYAYQWQRCSQAGICTNVAGALSTTYTAVAADVGLRLRVVVFATNSAGSASVSSNLSAVVAAGVGAPANTTKPTITATSTTVGTAVTGSIGAWTGSQPISYSYAWSRCDTSGGRCQPIANATGPTYVISSADAGSRLEFVVTAGNPGGSTIAASTATAVVTTGPAGATRLPDGRVSIPASSVTLPNRLVISALTFSPNPLRSRSAFTARFRVTDNRGYVVRDALVYTIGLPYSWLRSAAEVATGTDGYAVMNLFPNQAMPLHRGAALVMFVRARKQGDSILAGVSTRRLVQVRISP